ncbi:MAG: hypothetical protein PHG08_00965 [Bacilli bacterium]|nr:hypothetical protein [Bacilli bacterium]
MKTLTGNQVICADGTILDEYVSSNGEFSYLWSNKPTIFETIVNFIINCNK